MSDRHQSQRPITEAPPTWTQKAGPEGAPGAPPLISVIIPFDDSRGKPGHLDGWTREQTLDGSLFEVIALTDGRLGPGMEESIPQHLRPQDRHLLVHEEGRFAMYAAGAEAARGSILFITEDHCVAEPGCLAAVKRHFETTSDSGVTVRWGHINNTDVAYMEELVNRIDARQWSQPDHWNKVRIRGFGVRRDAYRDVGGMEWKYQGFSEALLAAKLHAHGHRVGYTDEAGIFHINTESMAELEQSAWNYSWAECEYCQEHDTTFCEHYFSASTGLASQVLTPAPMARWMTRALLQGLLGDRAFWRGGAFSRWGVVATACQLGMSALASRLRQAAAWGGTWMARLRYHFWRFHEGHRLRAFGDFWRRVSHAARVSYAVKQEGGSASSSSLQWADAGNLVASGCHGCFGTERFEGRTFRWAGPVAVVPLHLPAADCKIAVDTGRLRGAVWSYPVAVFWNRKAVPHDMIQRRDSLLIIKIKRRMCRKDTDVQELTLVAAPAVQQGFENRWLGLPICSIRLHEQAAEKDLASLAGAEKKNSADHASVSQAPPKDSGDPSRRIVVVNTADRGGGAETVAWYLLQEYRRKHGAACMWVGHKNSNDPAVLASLQQGGQPRVSMARRVLRNIRRRMHRARGLEDFEFPSTMDLLRAGGEQADIVHLHNLHGGFFDLRALAPLSQKVPLFVTLHDSWMLTGRCASPGPCNRWASGCGNCPDLQRPPILPRDATAENWRRKQEIYSQSRLRIATPSRWLMEKVQQSMLAPALIEGRVIPNGIDARVFHPGDKSQARAALQIPEEAALLVSVAKGGAANPYKDFATLHGALSRLQTRGDKIVCVVVGREAPTETFSNGVVLRHVGMAVPGTVARWFQAADLCVHSTHEEVFGLVLAEALACGTPVVASHVGGIPEVIRQGRDGLLVPPGNPQAFAAAIEDLLSNRPRLREMGRDGAAYASTTFDAARMAGEYLAWFEEVLAERTASRA